MTLARGLVGEMLDLRRVEGQSGVLEMSAFPNIQPVVLWTFHPSSMAFNTIEMDISEEDAEALYSSNAVEREKAKSAWLARRDEILTEWQRHLLGRTFLEVDNATTSSDEDNVSLTVEKISTGQDVHLRITLESVLYFLGPTSKSSYYIHEDTSCLEGSLHREVCVIFLLPTFSHRRTNVSLFLNLLS